jgi:TrmH family RNA methyltransferase
MLSKAKIKDIQSLQHKKFRDQSGLFVAEGPKVVMDLIANGQLECVEIFALNEWIENLSDGNHERLTHLIHSIKDFELEKISGLVTPNSVLAVFRKRLPDVNFEVKGMHTIVLDGIRDPGNLGTIIRSADWFGIKNIVCSPDCVDLYNAKVVQSTMASVGNVNVIYTPIKEWLKGKTDVPVLAALLNGVSLSSCSGMKESIIMIGNESEGLSEELIAMADRPITIPGAGTAESLNAAVAASLFMYELKR